MVVLGVAFVRFSSLAAAVLLVGCGPNVGPAQDDGTSTSGADETAAPPQTGTSTGTDGTPTTDAVDETTDGPQPSVCQTPKLEPDAPPPGSNCQPGPPSPGGLCHEVIDLPLLEDHINYTDLFDVDGDGQLDLLMVGSGWAGAAISVPGAWPRLAATSSLDPYQGPAAVGDLDDDGVVELLVGRSPVSSYEASGDGAFTGRLATPIPGTLLDAFAGDIDGDALDDLVLVHIDSTVSSLRNLGEGRLATEWTRSVACLDPQAAALADFDGDGMLDLAISSGAQGDLTVLSGDGQGGFTASTGLAGLGETLAIAAADFDGDGAADAAVLDATANRVAVVSFEPSGPVVAAVVALDDDVRSLAIADLQADGVPDIVVGRQAHAVSWALSLGDGTFADPGTVEIQTQPLMLEVADLDDNGLVDVLAIDSIGTYTRLAASADGSLGDPSLSTFLPQLQDVALVDLDGDGRAEAITLNADRYGVKANNPGGQLGPVQNELLPEAHDDLRFALAADLDGDTMGDVIMVGDSISTIVRRGHPSGQPDDDVDQVLAHAEAAGISVADFDEDGRPDFVMNAQSAIEIWHADGSGGIVPGSTVAPLSGSPTAHATADINSDGHADVVWAGPFDFNLWSALGDGQGGFGPPLASPLLSDPTGLQIGDVDEDGFVDVVTTVDFHITVLAGVGDGTFVDQGPLQLEHSRQILADFNGDGHLDLASYDWLSSALVIAVGAGDGSFDMQGSFPMDFIGIFPTAADLNGDGRADAVLRGEEGTLRMLMSNPCGCGD